MKLLITILVVVVLIVAVVVLVSFLVGGVDQAVNGPRTDPGASDPCEDCKNYNNWYNSLPTWRQNAEFAYYWIKRVDCEAKGCRFSP